MMPWINKVSILFSKGNVKARKNVLKMRVLFSVFTSHLIEAKDRNHSIKNVKNLGDDR